MMRPTMRPLDTPFLDDDLDTELARSLETTVDLELPADAKEIAGEAREAGAVTGGAARRDAASVAASILIHAAIVAALFIGPSGAAWLINVAGKKDMGLAAAGDAAADRVQGSRPQSEERPIHVTLVAPPTPQPKHPASPTPPRSRASETEKAAPEAVAAAERPADKPQKPAPEVLATEAPSKSGETAPPLVKQQPPKPEPQKAETADAAKAAAEARSWPTPAKADAPKPDEAPQPEQQAQQPAVAAAVPVPTPRPTPPAPQLATAAPPGGPLSVWRGSLTGALTGADASTREGGADAGSGNAAVSNYPGRVARKLQAALRYPPAAARRGITGEARVHFVVDAGGRVRDVRLVASSGSDLLDRAAVETVRRAAPLPPIPKAAGRSEWSFTAPVSFSRVDARRR